MSASLGDGRRLPHELRTGRSAPPPPRRYLHAGPVTAYLDGADLRHVRRGGRELAQRVYMAVRDEVWGTVPAELSDVVVEQGEDSFRATFSVVNRQDPIDFAWRGEIVGEPDGTITYTLRGEAKSAFRYAKIGFNVHHPLLESVGRRYRATGEDGVDFEGTLEAQIEPQRVVDGKLTGMFPPYSALAIDYLDGAEARFSFEGDLFELQDHRNWADGNFKSYGTPLSVPWPMDAEPGQEFFQRVTITSVGLGDSSADAAEVELEVGGPSGHRLPAIGLGQGSHGERLSDRERELVALAAPAHLRVPARLHEAGWQERVAAGLADCAALGARVELAVSTEPGDEQRLDELAGMLTAAGAPDVARVLVLERQDEFTPTAPITTEDSLRRVRERLGAAVGQAPFAGGSDQFFSDVNRNPPPEAGLDAVCFGLCPQVHAADDGSLMENLPALADCVTTSRILRPGLPVAVSPVTLVPRLGPYPGGAPVPGGLPGSVDVRLMALFGASWALGAVAWLAGVDTESATFFETSGWQGIVERDGGSPLPDLVPSRPGEAFPVLHALADVAECRDGTLLELRSSNLLGVNGLAVQRGDGRRVVLLANHGPDPRPVVLRGLGADTAQVRRLDETTAEQAMADPVAFRSQSARCDCPGGTLELELPPYGLARVEA